MENTQKKVYAKYTFASISLALVLIAMLALMLSRVFNDFINSMPPQTLIGIVIVYMILFVILSLVGITLVIRGYKYIYASKKQGIPVKGVFLTSVAAIIFVLVFGSFSFLLHETIRAAIDPCYNPGPFYECMPPAPELPRNI